MTNEKSNYTFDIKVSDCYLQVIFDIKVSDCYLPSVKKLSSLCLKIFKGYLESLTVPKDVNFSVL